MLAISLAPRTRERTGTSAKVIIPVRWDHSEVTSRMPATGSRKAAGFSPTSRTDGEGVVRRVADDRADDDDDHGDRDGGDLEPEAGAGVDHLAQLDGDEAAEAGARVDAGGVHADRCGEGGGAHAVAPVSSGWVESVCGDGALPPDVVSSKKRRSRPASSAGASRRSTMPLAIASAGDDLGLGLDEPPIAVGGVRRQAGR